MRGGARVGIHLALGLLVALGLSVLACLSGLGLMASALTLLLGCLPLALALGAPLGLVAHLRALRQDGELRALLPQGRSALGWLLAPLLLCLSMQAWLGLDLLPRQRAGLEVLRQDPVALLRLGASLPLDRLAHRSGGLAWSCARSDVEGLHELCLLQRRDEDWIAISAARLRTGQGRRLVLEQGKLWRSGDAAELGFDRMGLEEIGLAGPSRSGISERSPGWWSALLLLLGLGLAWGLQSGILEPGRARSFCSWLLPPLLAALPPTWFGGGP